MNKISFQDYLTDLLGEKTANKLLGMTPEERENRAVIVTGKQGPTGKSTLEKVLKKRGYQVISLYDCIVITLDKEICNQIPNFEEVIEEL